MRIKEIYAELEKQLNNGIDFFTSQSDDEDLVTNVDLNEQ